MISLNRRSIFEFTALFIFLALVSLPVPAQEPPVKTAKDYFAEGLEFQRAGEHQKALESYPAVLKIDPQYIPALLNTGVAFHKLRKHKAGINAFKTSGLCKPELSGLQLF